MLAFGCSNQLRDLTDGYDNFIEVASKQFPKLWSVRFALLAAIASAIEAGMPLYASGTAPILVVVVVVVVAAGLTSLGAAIARVVAQPALTGNG